MKQFSHLLASALIIWTLQVFPSLSNAQGAELHTLGVANGVEFKCDMQVHSVTVKIPAGVKIVGTYMFVSTNAEWEDAWLSTNNNLISELHTMREPIPTNNGSPAYGWFQRSQDFEFAPNWYTAADPSTVNGWCNNDGSSMLIYAEIRYVVP